MTHDTLKAINTNELRDYADRISNPYSQLILDAASELDATRTERNILRAALLARVEELEADVNRERARSKLAADACIEYMDLYGENDFWRGFPLVQIDIQFRSNGLGEKCPEGSYYSVHIESKHGRFINVLQTPEQLELLAAELNGMARAAFGEQP